MSTYFPLLYSHHWLGGIASIIEIPVPIVPKSFLKWMKKANNATVSPGKLLFK